MARFSGARFYQQQGSSQPQQSTFDAVHDDHDFHVESAPIASETDFIKTTPDRAPRLSLHMPPHDGFYGEQDVLHGAPEQERYDSEAHLIRKDT